MSHNAPLNAEFDATVLAAELPRHVLAGYMRYRHFRPIAQGGKAEVLRCIDVNLGREVAIKILHSRLMDRPAEQRMLVREARTMAALTHAAIPQVHDVGRDGDGRPYFTMTLRRGKTLHHIFELLRLGDEGARRIFTLERLVFLLGHVAEVLVYAHGMNVVHCDLKPENILVEADSRVCILDWGLAVVDDYPVGGDPNPAVYERGRQGSVLYMAPEQATGELHLRAAVDVYSLGAILYECLTLDTPCRGTNAEETLANVIGVEPTHPRRTPGLPGITAELEMVCLKALSKSPTERYATMADFREALRDCHLDLLVDFERAGEAMPDDYSPLIDATSLEALSQRPTRVYGAAPTPLLTN